MAIVKDASGNSPSTPEGAAGRAVDQSLDNDRFAITASDTIPLPAPIDAILVGTGGTVRFKNPDGSTTDEVFAAGGPYYVGQPTHVYSTGTTASGLVGVVSKGLR